MSEKGKTTDFGFQKVPWGEKQKRVGAVFDSVAGRYDLMNDLMSFGIHRLWKKFAIELAAVRTGERVLDLAGGTGDLSTAMAARVGAKGQVICSDINFSMLGVGRQRLTDRGVAGNVAYVQANAEALPFADNRLDCITIGFGLRNVTDKQAALGSMYRVLRPGGRLLILEFSKPQLPGLSKLYDEYSFRFLPLMGRLVAQDSDSYRYLAESIRMHPDQETLKRMMEQAGYARCQFYNLTGGIVAVHRGYKL
jgi:demethylmenaquinone methyltransferase/2-methoxy-6-polyprenyl-1,4-benzoquinol methylase